MLIGIKTGNVAGSQLGDGPGHYSNIYGTALDITTRLRIFDFLTEKSLILQAQDDKYIKKLQNKKCKTYIVKDDYVVTDKGFETYKDMFQSGKEIHYIHPFKNEEENE